MSDLFTANLTKGILFVRRNPQALYSLVVLVIIVSAFIFMAQRFVSMTLETKERLQDVRTGAIHDTFVQFAPEKLSDAAFIAKVVKRIVAANPSITEFRVSSFDGDTFSVIASLEESEVGKADRESGQKLYQLSSVDVTTSYTIADVDLEGRSAKTARALVNEEGRVVGMVMTRESRAEADRVVEAEIRKSILILSVIVALIVFLFVRYARIIDYSALYRELKNIDEMKDNFISMASHELRTPLTIIRGYADILASAPGFSPKEKEAVGNIDRGVKQLDELVTDMLDVARLEQGRMSFDMKPMNPAPLLEEIIRSFQPQAESRGLGLISAIEGGGEVIADHDRLRQVFVNLIGNAIKYSKKGEIRVRLYAEHDLLKIRVSDTGPGISSEDQGRLFQKFFRVKSEDTRDVSGTGLGLWISKQIVENMKGKLSVESIKGVGSHFIVSFTTVVPLPAKTA